MKDYFGKVSIKKVLYIKVLVFYIAMPIPMVNLEINKGCFFII